MATVINLNRFRKAKKSAEAERRAADNRALFGRSKKERRQADRERDRLARELDGKRIE
jgi:ribosomal protein S2